jgi:hypothetical protein
MLLFLVLLFGIGLKSSTPLCNNFFPKIIGGKSLSTYINDFDVDDNTVYTCGGTSDSNLVGYTLPNDCGGCCLCYVPMVTASDINSNEMKWGFTDKT